MVAGAKPQRVLTADTKLQGRYLMGDEGEFGDRGALDPEHFFYIRWTDALARHGDDVIVAIDDVNNRRFRGNDSSAVQ